MANEFKVKNGLIVIGDLTTSGTITINGALAATQSWVTSQAYLTSASLSGYATQSYVTSAISALVDAAPAALDTLNELAAALGDDANFSTTITNSIASKQAQLNGTGLVRMSGTSVSYDNSTYLTTYTETDTLSSVTGRGATTNTSITVGPDLTVQADGSSNYTASRLWLNSHNNYRGAGVHMSGTGSTWFAGTPYTDFDGGYVIARTGTSNDNSSAQYSNALLTVKSSGNIGIGTSNPGSKLSVFGNNDVFSVISQTGDTSFATRLLAQYVGLFNNGANGHHLYISSSQELGPAEFNLTKTWGGVLTLGVSGDGTARTRALYVNSNGYVGVNVNPISGDRFEVAGSVRIHTGNNWDAIQIYSDGANGYIQGLGDETGLRIRSEAGNILLADNRGNVGIGITNPVQKLDVNGNISLGSWTKPGSTYVGLRRADDGSFGGGGDSGLVIESYNHVSPNGGDYSQRVHLRTHLYNGGSNNVLTAYGTNVGIGTSTPGYKLETIGNARISGNLSIGTTYNGFAANIEGTVYVIGASVWVNDGYGFANASSSTGMFPDSSHNITFKSNNSTKVYINAAGNVGIGTTSPGDYKLYVNGGQFGTLLKGGDLGTGSDVVRMIKSDGSAAMLVRGDGKVGIGTLSPAEELHVIGRGIFDGGSGNSSTDAVVYITKSTNDDWGLYVNNAGLDYGMYTRTSPSANYAFAIHNGTTWTTRITGNATVFLGEKNAIEGNSDSWLRLNNSNHYASGVYTPYNLRNDGAFDNYGGIYGYNTIRGRKAQTINNYTTAALWTESYDVTTTGIAFHISGVVGKFLEMRTNGVLYWENAQVWTSGTLTNLNQLTNGPGYITGYSETDTLASVTSRGATTSSTLTSTSQLGLYVNSGSASYIGINSTSNWAYVSLLNNGSTTWDIGAYNGGTLEFRPYGSGTNAMYLNLDGSLFINSINDGKLNLRVPSGDSSEWNYINFTGSNGVRDAYFGTDGGGTPTWWRDDNGVNITLGSSVLINGNTAWHAGNDGSGSGLDADTVDGVQADSIVYGNARGTNQSITNNNNDLDKTGYYTADAFTTRPSGVANWMYIEHIKLYNDNTAYQKQLGYDTYDDRMWVRTKSGGAWSSWKQIWTSDSLTNLSQLTNGPGYITSSALSGYATTSYVTTQINNLIAGAPGVLDTLDELAAALGDDSNFATTVTNSIAGKVSKSGDTMTSSGQQVLNIFHGAATGDFNDALFVKNTVSEQQVQIGMATTGSDGDHHRVSLRAYKGAQALEGVFGIALRQPGSAAHTQRLTLDYLGNLTIGGFLTESSSLKLKENVETSEGNLEKVVNLRPVTYNKIGSQITELGLIAEEVAEVYPEFVQYDENGEPIGVNYSRLTAALIGAVKELTKRIETLENNG